jgi:hypothetical protein
VTELGDAYRSEVPEYAALPRELIAGEVLRVSRSVIEVFLDAVAKGKPPDASLVGELEEMGRRRLEMGISLEALLHVYRVAGREFFNTIVAEIRVGEEGSLREIGAYWVDYIDRCSTRASTGYIEASNERVRRIEARRSAVLQALIAANDQAEVAAVASEFSIGVASAYAPILVAADQGRLDDLVAVSPANSLAGFRGSVLLLLAPEAVPSLRPVRATFGDILVVWGRPVAPGSTLRAEIEQAERVLASALARGITDVLGPDDLLVDQLVLSGRRSATALDRLVLGPLRAKDPGGALVATLKAFLSCGSIPEAARIAVVHPNTAAYRLRRVAELTGYDPRVPAEAAVLVLAVAAHDLSTNGGL